MQPTSAAQFAAAGGDGVPPLERVRDDLWALGVPLPGVLPGALPHATLSYLILDASGAVHVIDPGWDSDDNWHALASSLASLGRTPADIATVTVTHLHPDHLGMAERVRDASGATVAIHRTEQLAIRELTTTVAEADALARFDGWGVPPEYTRELLEAVRRRSAWTPFTADRLLDDGDVLDIPGRKLTVLHTPGHTTGHIALLDADRALVFTGDLLLPNQFPGVGLGGSSGTNPIDDYLASLRSLVGFDDHEVLPGHGYRFTGLADRCEATAAHHDRRTREVASVLDTTRTPTVWQIAGQLSWTAGWVNLRGFHLLSALSQTALHIDRVSGATAR